MKDRYYVYTIIYNFADDPCATDNGRCAQKCTNDNGAATCSCTTGTLGADGHTCDPGIAYRYILYWKGNLARIF